MSVREDFRVLVTGSRSCTPDQAAHVRDKLRRACSEALAAGRRVIVVQGRCHLGGVDLAAEQWAEQTPGVEPENHPAGPGDRLARNTRMVALGAEICLAFPARGSKGTWDCLIKAAEAGIIGRVYPL